MSARDLEKRVALLENTLQEMKAFLTKKESEPWWERTAGMFEGDEVFDEIVEEMRKARQADYEAVCRELDREAENRKARKSKPVRQGLRKAKRGRDNRKL